MALKITVHVVNSFVKGHRKSGVILINESHFKIIIILKWLYVYTGFLSGGDREGNCPLPLENFFVLQLKCKWVPRVLTLKIPLPGWNDVGWKALMVFKVKNYHVCVNNYSMILNFSWFSDANYLDCLTFVLYLLTLHTTSIITTNRTKEMLPITDPVMTAVLSFGIGSVLVLVVVVVVVGVAVAVVIN